MQQGTYCGPYSRHRLACVHGNGSEGLQVPTPLTHPIACLPTAKPVNQIHTLPASPPLSNGPSSTYHISRPMPRLFIVRSQVNHQHPGPQGADIARARCQLGLEQGLRCFSAFQAGDREPPSNRWQLLQFLSASLTRFFLSFIVIERWCAHKI